MQSEVSAQWCIVYDRIKSKSITYILFLAFEIKIIFGIMQETYI